MENQQNQQQTKKPSNSLAWLILIIVIIALGVGTYFLFFQEKGTNTNNSNTIVNANTNKNVNSVSNTNTAVNGNTNTVVNTNIDTSDWKNYDNKELGFSISYPANWYIGTRPASDATEPFAYIASSIEYINFYINGKTDIQLPSEGFKIKLFVNKGMGSNQDPKIALKTEPGREALPLINEKFITINGIQAYRAFRQAKHGDKILSGQTLDITRTDVEYTFLHDKNLYRIWLEIDSNNPDQVISTFDRVASTFKLI